MMAMDSTAAMPQWTMRICRDSGRPAQGLLSPIASVADCSHRSISPQEARTIAGRILGHSALPSTHSKQPALAHVMLSPFTGSKRLGQQLSRSVTDDDFSKLRSVHNPGNAMYYCVTTRRLAAIRRPYTRRPPVADCSRGRNRSHVPILHLADRRKALRARDLVLLFSPHVGRVPDWRSGLPPSAPGPRSIADNLRIFLACGCHCGHQGWHKA